MVLVIFMSEVIWIPFKFPSLNEYINAERRNRFLGAKMKKEWTELVRLHTLRGLSHEVEFPTGVKFIIHEQNSRRDIDNVSSMVCKFCLDGMKASGMIPDDSQKYINKIECDIVIDGKVGVEICLK